MPVYLEGFEPVIRPSIASLQAACAAYRAQGGSASIFVNDDGLQLLDAARRSCHHPSHALLARPLWGDQWPSIVTTFVTR